MDNLILILFAAFLTGLIVLDIAMVVSLARPGDERRQMVVWKASTYTLLGTSRCDDTWNCGAAGQDGGSVHQSLHHAQFDGHHLFYMSDVLQKKVWRLIWKM